MRQSNKEIVKKLLITISNNLNIYNTDKTILCKKTILNSAFNMLTCVADELDKVKNSPYPTSGKILSYLGGMQQESQNPSLALCQRNYQHMKVQMYNVSIWLHGRCCNCNIFQQQNNVIKQDKPPRIILQQVCCFYPSRGMGHTTKCNIATHTN